MPEGDTIHRAARTLERALAGRTVTRFLSVYPHLTRVDHDTPLQGRQIERVEARGKHLLITISGGLVLRSHMRMHGSWHLYRPGERWQRPRHAMRIVIETEAWHAVAFDVPVAEWIAAGELERAPALRELGPDVLDPGFSIEEAVARIAACGDAAIADVLLDQRVIAGLGNVYKSEALFTAGLNPFSAAGGVPRDRLQRLVEVSVRFLRVNTTEGGMRTYTGLRRTTGRDDPGARYWVYGRGGRPCRRCGTPIARAAQGPHARSTYWCERCQPAI